MAGAERGLSVELYKKPEDKKGGAGGRLVERV